LIFSALTQTLHILYLEFYNYLAARNLIIYPGKLTQAASFRIGSIGELYLDDMKNVVQAVHEYLKSKNIPIPVPYK
jgi:2-aminoethylphosphonate-pyruvate transaminase